MMTNRDYSRMIHNAIEKDEVVKLLRSEGEYCIPLSNFAVVSLPVDINEILIECFYEQYRKIDNIKQIFYDAMIELISGTTKDLYFAIEYFNNCMFHEEDGIATFKIMKEKLASLICDEIEKKWMDLKYGDNNFDLHLIYKWNRRYQKKYGFSIAPDLEEIARNTYFDIDETTEYYESLIKRAISNNEVMQILRGENNNNYQKMQMTVVNLMKEISRVLVCCFYMQMGRIDKISDIFHNSIISLLHGNVSDILIARVFLYYCSYYEQCDKTATFYVDYEKVGELKRETYIKNKQQLYEGVILKDDVKIKIPWSELIYGDSELIKNCAYKFNCWYEPED